MVLKFPVSEFFQNSGNNAALFTERVRDEVATFACELWRDFPDFYTDGINPANSFARGFMNQMCVDIQPPLPPPTVPFIGGQCCDAMYDVTATWTLRRCFGDVIVLTGPGTVSVNGRVLGIILQPCTLSPGLTCLDVQYQNCQGDILYETLTSTTRGLAGFDCQSVGSTDPNADSINPFTSVFEITAVTRTDGFPDDCGDPLPRYNSPDPTSDDLNTDINININDGLDLNLELQYIQNSPQYNFPMNFKVNGFNVSLDLGGLNFYAPDGFTSPSGDNNVPPPGSDPGTDGAGGDIVKTYPENEYPVGPDALVPRQVTEAVQYFVCEEGVIESITTTFNLITGSSPILFLILEILGQILTDLCETPEPTLGLPEYYGLAPGVERPAIVYLWKEFIDGKWMQSTYSSTVSHPTEAAIANIENLTNIEKIIGTYKTFIRLTDGSVIKATGSDPTISNANFQFLFSQVKPAFKPSNSSSATITQQDSRLSVKTLTLRQIEYYPVGKKDNVPPTIKRVINPE